MNKDCASFRLNYYVFNVTPRTFIEKLTDAKYFQSKAAASNVTLPVSHVSYLDAGTRKLHLPEFIVIKTLILFCSYKT